MARTDNWQSNFNALKAHVAQTGHFPNKHTKLNNWCRYQRKRIKAGMMPRTAGAVRGIGCESLWRAYGWETEEENRITICKTTD